MDGESNGNPVAPPRFDARLALVVYVRILAMVFIASGLRRWAVVLGPLAPGGDLLALPVPVIVATVFFAAFDLVAAVGLWLLASWGTVVWLISALTELALHTAFRDLFPFEPGVVVFHVVTVVIYAVLTMLYERQRDI
ncbi:DUF6163 family protein [Oharaeibacter diazotrophicus]|uniref:DoxX-like protein n=1 Tax=Oharaeibacter diazotrophicus TaxID=1920512 RepID=A0A4R6RJ27_9HYPH|nr:DUF6163 family protein [Oharaeibacter diazotrophicus]TDP86450.1 hypothetical protein EDD54_0325 [Oharaeibacter diazotrophicus]BBE71608.1 hypothetical protein OHA_1_01186 [Pleomorphomonas sp. SM30]GLS78370.1 hypothetical protein GCM10007904_37070 [Oharaeibacter diazotrophicus]